MKSNSRKHTAIGWLEAAYRQIILICIRVTMNEHKWAVRFFVVHRHIKTVSCHQGGKLQLNRTQERTVFQVKKAGLAHVLHPCTSLANFRLLEAHPCARTPSEHSEWPRTCLALLAISVFSLQTKTTVSHMYTVGQKTCHFVFDYNSGVSWSIFLCQ